MSCNNPVTCYYSNKINDETGKRSLVFKQQFAYRGSDPTIPRSLEVPCGKCLGCRADQSLMWSIRSYHESQLHEQNSFITLTYDNEHLPHDNKIDKRHLQLFFKRLRKSLSLELPPVKIRYLACGEYGGQTKRPHYHAIVFGRDWLEDSQTINDTLYTNQKLVDVWGQGMVSIAPVTMASICYVCGYVNKKQGETDTFNLMSRKPGIGHDWLDKYSEDLERTGIVTIEGRSYSIPKRYLVWNEEQLAEVKKSRTDYARAKVKNTDSLERYNANRAKEEKLQIKLKAVKLKEKM